MKDLQEEFTKELAKTRYSWRISYQSERDDNEQIYTSERGAYELMIKIDDEDIVISTIEKGTARWLRQVLRRKYIKNVDYLLINEIIGEQVRILKTYDENGKK